jgi:hypothetical protein
VLNGERELNPITRKYNEHTNGIVITATQHSRRAEKDLDWLSSSSKLQHNPEQ